MNRIGGSMLRFSVVLMGNHVHLVTQTHRPNLSRWMHWLTVAYTVFFNQQHRIPHSLGT
jgi:hypothetical protein